MTTKEQVLALLEANRTACLSGAALAQQLGLSRNAVWKAVKALERDGYTIEAAPNKGYRLCDDCDKISAQGIRSFLREPLAEISVFDSLESTNITAKERAVAGAGHGTVVLAETQTAGKGRYGRDFFSPPGHGIYMSVVLHPQSLRFQTPTLVTAFAAVSVCQAIEAISEEKPQIKWVNDLFLNGKKICGISTQAVTDFESGAMQWIVLGIGINFTAPASGVPAELQSVVGSIFANGRPPTTRNRLIAEILNGLLCCGNRQTEDRLLALYRARLMMLGKAVTVVGSGESYRATALDIDDAGRLIVKKENGALCTLLFGEVSIRG